MNRIAINTSIFFKHIALLMRPHIVAGWLRHPFLTASNLLSMTRWIAKQDKRGILNDFFTFRRDYARRYVLYQHVLEKAGLKDTAVDYLEFGVCGGNSFQWWLSHNTNPESKFYGFDTFEGLPEGWGIYNKGDMSATIPVVDDSRARFVKGLFQDSVPGFLREVNLENGKRKIIHLDADLFSSTLFALTSLAPYLKKGDILLFDEFNVPNHEYFAFRMFCDSYYVKTKMLGAMNNYFEVAMEIV